MVIHFDTGYGLMMPISGRHTKCACGKTFQDNHEPDRVRFAKDWEVVTCKKCLKKDKRDR